MTITLTPAPLSGSVTVLSSKSHVHRLLICAALADKPTTIRFDNTSEDIEATTACLRALGAQIDVFDGGATVTPVCRGELRSPVDAQCARLLDSGESGSTLRFLIPVAAGLSTGATFIGRGKLMERPTTPVYDELITRTNGTFVISKQLQPGTFTIPGNISSQFYSGLLFILPILDGDSEIIVDGALESLPYVDLTLDCIRMFGVKIDFGGTKFVIPGNQKYISPDTIIAEGDWSNAAFWLCAGAIGNKEIALHGMNLKSVQGDMGILDILRRMGAHIDAREDEILVSRDYLQGIEVDATDIPDLIPVVATTASVAKGTTVIKNAARLRFKESDRLATTCAMLSAMGADIRETEDGLIINGVEQLTGGETDSYMDHRIAMAAAVAAVVSTGEVKITGAHAVRKSYPTFWDEYVKLGGKVTKS